MMKRNPIKPFLIQTLVVLNCPTTRVLSFHLVNNQTAIRIDNRTTNRTTNRTADPIDNRKTSLTTNLTTNLKTNRITNKTMKSKKKIKLFKW